jgi:type 1 glutamine amidotransferase
MKATNFTRLILAAIVVASLPAAGYPAAAQTANLRALLITHGELVHDFRKTAPLLLKSLLDTGMDIEQDVSLELLDPDKPENLNRFDAIILHGRFLADPKQERAGEEEMRKQEARRAVQALTNFVTTGKGLVAIHIASSSFRPLAREEVSEPALEDWRRLIGRVWVYPPCDKPNLPKCSKHPDIRDFLVTAKPISAEDPAKFHPIMQGIGTGNIPSFKIKDELYLDLDVDAGAKEQVVAFAVEKEPIEEPMAITLEHGRGRVFHTTLGHDTDAYRNTMFLQMLKQGIEWVARKR